jgi:tRNA-splicing ligase RtcB
VLRAQAEIADALQRAVPAGVGVGREGYTAEELEAYLTDGARALVDPGVVAPEDLDAIEDGGRLEGAAPSHVSDRARDRGRQQLGTLGSGNHFLELGRVDEIYDATAAEAFGLALGGVTLLVHSGSRGLGHAVCEELLPMMVKTSRRHGIALPDKQLACAPLGSPEAERYLGAMAAAANYAYVNRALMAHKALRALGLAAGVGRNGHGGRLLYDVGHNIAKWEEHTVDGVKRRLCVHRKGATRAFGPGHEALGEALRPWGQPVLIPGDMGRYSYVLRGAPGALAETFGSACHGAGRLLARGEARKRATGNGVLKALRDKGIALRAASVSAVVEEMPEAYKDVADVVSVVERAGLATRVARLTPLVVVKG